ncbi:MAG TPA: hypothetical protein VIY48_12020 [Candidatus Paceibacterota bacterium]
MKKFGDWLSETLIERDLKPADLTRVSKGKLDSGVLSNLINNKRKQPSVETCKLLAKYLPAPLEEVYRAADILPPSEDDDPVIEAVTGLMNGLPTTDKKDILEYAKFRRKLAIRDDFNANRKRTESRTSPA